MTIVMAIKLAWFLTTEAINISFFFVNHSTNRLLTPINNVCYYLNALFFDPTLKRWAASDLQFGGNKLRAPKTLAEETEVRETHLSMGARIQ